jgi:aspartate-semialdehyde dehydrogenase
MRRLLADRQFPLDGSPVLLASARSAGTSVEFKGEQVTIQELTADAFAGVELALFSAGATRSREFAAAAVAAGAVVVDNSSAFRMDADVPLVVSEVNPDDILDRPRGIIANPNCTTMVLMLPAKALHDRFGLTSMVVTTYQAAGGAGQGGMSELLEQTIAFSGQPELLRTSGAKLEASATPDNFSRAIAFNVLPHCGDFEDDRYTVEERKLVDESRKILHLPDLAVSPTCVRVPVMAGHSIVARMTFARDVTRAEAMAALADFPSGMRIVDGIGRDGEALEFPTALASAGEDDVLVGRVREDLGDTKSLNLFVSGDNLLKGAALNTVQIAELVAAS